MCLTSPGYRTAVARSIGTYVNHSINGTGQRYFVTATKQDSVNYVKGVNGVNIISLKYSPKFINDSEQYLTLTYFGVI